MIKAQIVADSINRGNRLTTMLVTFPRFLLAELNTHRILSKNSASSRAIPFKKMVESVENNPFIPIAWQKEHKGMQGNEYWMEDDDFEFAPNQWQQKTERFETDWLLGRDRAVNIAKIMNEDGLTKQLCNRLLEPFMMHTVLISGTEWSNFFELRCPQYPFGPTMHKSRKDWMKDWEQTNDIPYYPTTDLEWLQLNKGQAEIHMMALAEAMWDAMNESTPKELQAGEWHIPFEEQILKNREGLKQLVLNDWLQDKNKVLAHVAIMEYVRMEDVYGSGKIMKISTAMAARTSYTVVGDEKEFSYEQQIALHDRMAEQVPFHASPFEHCARVMTEWEYQSFVKGNTLPIDNETNFREKKSEGWCRNYRGFVQYREILENK